MKKINYLFICLLLSMAVVVGCKSDDEGTPSADGNLDKIAGSWKVKTAKVDGTDLPEYEDMVLTISKSPMTFKLTGAPPASAFPDGSFTDAGNNYEKVKVDNIIVTLTPSDKALKATFKLDDEGENAGRVTGLGGSYSFEFEKQ